MYTVIPESVTAIMCILLYPSNDKNSTLVSLSLANKPTYLELYQTDRQTDRERGRGSEGGGNEERGMEGGREGKRERKKEKEQYMKL